jgi:hypothetical protein
LVSAASFKRSVDARFCAELRVIASIKPMQYRILIFTGILIASSLLFCTRRATDVDLSISSKKIALNSCEECADSLHNYIKHIWCGICPQHSCSYIDSSNSFSANYYCPCSNPLYYDLIILRFDSVCNILSSEYKKNFVPKPMDTPKQLMH